MKVLKKIYYVVTFIFYFLYKLVMANLYIAWDILTPKMHTNPGFVWVPVTVEKNIGLLLLSNLISMTPGTLSIDYAKEKRELLVHYLYKNEKNNVLEDIEKMQQKVKQLIA